MKKMLAWIALSLMAASAGANTSSFTLKGTAATDVAGAMLTAGVKEQRVSKQNVFTYTLNNVICKSSNHGGPGDYGLSYLVGCYRDAKFDKPEFGNGYGTGTRLHDASDLVSRIETAAEAAQIQVGDCAMGQCYSVIQRVQCTINTQLELSQGCSCTITIPYSVD